MKVRYRILQARWPGGGEWRNWGFFYQSGNAEDREARLMYHHNLDEL